MHKVNQSCLICILVATSLGAFRKGWVDFEFFFGGGKSRLPCNLDFLKEKSLKVIGEPYRFGGYLDPSVQTEILLFYYKDNITINTITNTIPLNKNI